MVHAVQQKYTPPTPSPDRVQCEAYQTRSQGLSLPPLRQKIRPWERDWNIIDSSSNKSL